MTHNKLGESFANAGLSVVDTDKPAIFFALTKKY